MDALKLVLAFSPWIAFWIISAGHTLLLVQIGICAAVVMVVVMGVTGLHRGAVLWAGVIFFAFALATVVWLKNMWVIHHLGVLARGTLFTATLLSILANRSFTESYAREHVPRELWGSPTFRRSCLIVTGVWGLIFLANTLVNVTKLYHPDPSEWAYRGLELGILVLGVVFTTVYSRVARRNREQGQEIGQS